MNQTQIYVEFYNKDKAVQSHAESSKQQGLSVNKSEYTKLVYIVSFAITVAAAYLVF